jgi:glucose/arabinose dehydrogenase
MIRRHLARSALIVLALAVLLAACGSSQRSQPVPLSMLTEAVDLQLIAPLETPTAFAIRPGDPPEIAYVASQNGAVYRVDVSSGGTREVASLRDRTKASGERGLLGLAFSPNGNEMYVHFTDLDGNTNVNAIEMANDTPDIETMRTLLFVEQPYSNHNGGQLLVDEKGNLLIGLGDGGASGDPLGHGQNPASLLGKILRISPNPTGSQTPYDIPGDNPFVQSATAAPEVLFLGLRNPWRFSIDGVTGDFWIADVGQNATEEINQVPAPGIGANLGWNLREGSRSFSSSTSEELTDPVYEWPNTGGASAIGGFVYRGSAIPELKGRYVFADFGQRGLLALDPDTGSVTKLDLPISAVVAFGQDNNQELYVVSLSSGVWALRPAR